MAICIPKQYVDKFKGALVDGTINPEKLVEMSSDERRKFFEPILGKDAAEFANTEFEKRILTKDVKQSLVTWAKQVAGLKPQLRQDIIGKIERLDERILNPKEEKAFLKDLAAQKLGANVTMEEAQKVFELAEKMKGLSEFKGDMKNNEKRLEYGRSVVALKNYVDDRKLASNRSLKDTLKQDPLSLPGRLMRGIASNAKAIQASMDNSAIFRQGWKVLWTNPTVWTKNAARSFDHLFTYRNQHQVLDELNADIVSRPTYDLMRKAKLDVGVNEEVFPTTLPEKLPVLGRVYKATENAYTAFVRKTRADVFDKYIKIAEANKVDLNQQELESIGKMVNSLTGRGSLGRLEPIGSTLNTFFFSPKNLKSHIDLLTQPFTGAGGSKFVRREAAKNLLKTTLGTAAVLGVAKMLAPDSVDFDPRSANFGKIKVGNTTFDVTGGMGSLLVLLARTGSALSKVAYDQSGGKVGADMYSFKNSTDGKMRDLTDPAFGQSNLLDVWEDFWVNKASPAMNFATTFMKGKTFDNKKPTVFAEGGKLFIPLPFQTMYEVYTDPEAKKRPGFAALATTMDMLGFATNTRQNTKGQKGQYEVSFEDALKAGKDLLPK